MPFEIGDLVYYDANEFKKIPKNNSDLRIGEVVGGYYLKKFSRWRINILPDNEPAVTVDVDERMIAQIIIHNKKRNLILATPKNRKKYTQIAGLLHR